MPPYILCFNLEATTHTVTPPAVRNPPCEGLLQALIWTWAHCHNAKYSQMQRALEAKNLHKLTLMH